jgi:hypothetical protein
MGYRKLEKPHVEDIDELIKTCRLFNGETGLNGGYGCRSRSKMKSEPGKCYVWDCPLGYCPDLDDLKKLDKPEYEFWKDEVLRSGYKVEQHSYSDGCGESLNGLGCELVVVYQEVAK